MTDREKDPRIHMMDQVLQVLGELRVSRVDDEYTLQERIREHLDEHGILHVKEARLGPRNRVDFLVSGGIVIEVKRGKAKPNRTRVAQQLERYASFEIVAGIILVVDRNIHLPQEVNGKQCVAFGLNKLWGIAL